MLKYYRSCRITSFLLEVRQQPYNITVFCCFLPLFDKIFTQKEQDRSRSLPFLIRRHSVNLHPVLYNLQLQTLLQIKNRLSGFQFLLIPVQMLLLLMKHLLGCRTNWDIFYVLCCNKKDPAWKWILLKKIIALFCAFLYNTNEGTIAHRGLPHFMYVE